MRPTSIKLAKALVGSAAAAMTLMVVAPHLAAQGTATPNAPRSGLPGVPTTRILAIGRLTPSATPESRRDVMPAEVRETLSLYLGGKIDQWFVRQDQGGVVFLMNVSDLKEAHDLLENLPLGRAGMMEFELIPLGPLSPLSLLVSPPAAQPAR